MVTHVRGFLARSVVDFEEMRRSALPRATMRTMKGSFQGSNVARIYVDLDNVLVRSVMGGPFMHYGVQIVPRPDAEWFLRKLAGHGEPWLLTASSGDHPRRALRALGPSALRHFSGLITREDLAIVEAQIQVVLTARVDESERRGLWSLIDPIAPPGFVFDDFPVGSDVFALKATAVGIGPERWIQVESFDTENPDRGGLRKAYAEFCSRLGTRSRSRQEAAI